MANRHEWLRRDKSHRFIVFQSRFHKQEEQNPTFTLLKASSCRKRQDFPYSCFLTLDFLKIRFHENLLKNENNFLLFNFTIHCIYILCICITLSLILLYF